MCGVGKNSVGNLIALGTKTICPTGKLSQASSIASNSLQKINETSPDKINRPT